MGGEGLVYRILRVMQWLWSEVIAKLGVKQNNSDTFNPTNFQAGSKLRNDNSDSKIIAYQSVELSFIISFCIQKLFAKVVINKL